MNLKYEVHIIRGHASQKNRKVLIVEESILYINIPDTSQKWWKMSQTLTPFIYEMGTGVAGGFLVGYTIKKVLKILMTILALFFVAISYLGFSGILNINYDKLASAISGLSIQASEFFSTNIGVLPFASTFLAGLTFGMMKG